MNHYLSTRDKDWLRESGYPMSVEIARFYANRFVPCTESPSSSNSQGKFCMNNLMGSVGAFADVSMVVCSRDHNHPGGWLPLSFCC
jgi:hypothetical protein